SPAAPRSAPRPETSVPSPTSFIPFLSVAVEARFGTNSPAGRKFRERVQGGVPGAGPFAERLMPVCRALRQTIVASGPRFQRCRTGHHPVCLRCPLSTQDNGIILSLCAGVAAGARGTGSIHRELRRWGIADPEQAFMAPRPNWKGHLK